MEHGISDPRKIAPRITDQLSGELERLRSAVEIRTHQFLTTGVNWMGDGEELLVMTAPVKAWVQFLGLDLSILVFETWLLDGVKCEVKGCWIAGEEFLEESEDDGHELCGVHARYYYAALQGGLRMKINWDDGTFSSIGTWERFAGGANG